MQNLNQKRHTGCQLLNTYFIKGLARENRRKALSDERFLLTRVWEIEQLITDEKTDNEILVEDLVVDGTDHKGISALLCCEYLDSANTIVERILQLLENQMDGQPGKVSLETGTHIIGNMEAPNDPGYVLQFSFHWKADTKQWQVVASQLIHIFKENHLFYRIAYFD